MATLTDGILLEHVYHDGEDYKPGEMISVVKELYELWLNSGVLRPIEVKTVHKAKA